ncbi:50S ribosomal protein L24 [Eisenibacter elegans]|jgi:large subunit ribosomal protein L24|uniref:50S ribosomal protein L24 n=1 Tax=Eisenibacter elegans TaxID=997 RepID=UPI00040F083B|nr:50S ribosomal protein L24 [Eisenibacter elegans]
MENKSNKKPKLHLKKGDKVRVIAGNAKGEEGVVMQVFPEKLRATVEGINIQYKHRKPSAANPQAGERIEKEGPIHISNLMVIDPASGEPRRVGRRRNENGKLERYFKTHSSKQNK